MREYFSKLYGNGAVKKRIGRAIDGGKLPHAFLICGPDGSGKHTLALELAAALNCEKRADGAGALPCLKCNACRRIYGGNFTDITHLSRAGGKATVGVEEVRAFREDMFLSPTESAYKVYIIDEADKLTPNAQNALLKVLEEPPQSVIIILLAESRDKILTTVKSRVQTVAMQLFGYEELRDYLIKNSEKARNMSRLNKETLDGIVMSANGRIGQALSLLSDKEARENGERRELTERLISAFRPNAPYSELYSAVAELPTSRAELALALENAICAIRDVTLARVSENPPLIFYTSPSAAKVAAQDISTKRLLGVYDILSEALDSLNKNVGTSAVTAVLSAKIKLI